MAQADFEFLILHLLGGGDDRFMSAHLISASLGIEPRVLCMPGKHNAYLAWEDLSVVLDGFELVACSASPGAR